MNEAHDSMRCLKDLLEEPIDIIGDEDDEDAESLDLATNTRKRPLHELLSPNEKKRKLQKNEHYDKHGHQNQTTHTSHRRTSQEQCSWQNRLNRGGPMHQQSMQQQHKNRLNTSSSQWVPYYPYQPYASWYNCTQPLYNAWY